jgi:predicted dehydrogenase
MNTANDPRAASDSSSRPAVESNPAIDAGGASKAGVAGVVGVGIIGMGFMGRTHLAAYRRAQDAGIPCDVVAVSDRDEARRTGAARTAGNLASGDDADLIRHARGYERPDQLLADPAVHAVSICTPTDTHVALALQALDAGKHVLIEKPVALDVESILSLRESARAAGLICMPAMCMRWWPGWTWLKDAIQSRRYGRVVSASFTRIGSRPTWAHDFYLDPARSGGALFDLHVHDVDAIHWLFGTPAAVSSAGDHFGVTTLYHYEPDPADQSRAAPPTRVTATGAWMTEPGFAFRMRYLVEFERATADFDLTRTPPLRLFQGGEASDIPIGTGTGYDGEVIEFIRAITQHRDPAATLAEAATVAAVLDAERVSLRTRAAQPVRIRR